MNKSLLALAGAPLLALGIGTGPASAGEVRLHVHIGVPHVIPVVPVVVPPAVVYHAPVYYPSRVIYHQPRSPRHGWHKRHGHHGKHPHAGYTYRQARHRPGIPDLVRGPRHDGRRG